MSAPYEAPLGMMRAALSQAARAVGPALDIETAGAVLEEAGRIAREVLSPLNQSGDAAASRLTDHGVATPAGFPEAYRRFLEGGWPTICAPAEFGGQALPMLLGAAVTEIWGGANLSFAMCPEVAAGAVEALRMHAPPAIRKRYIPPLVSGEWTASMCLTEPHAGSDLSTLRTLAEPDGQSWRLKGRKIFISWGDHDLAANIIHLVLARTPGAPAGTQGISLFLVPKRLPADGARNDIQAVSIEHKMGIRASPTCVMALGEHGGARGWLIGPLHGGLACLFTMVNQMRLGVGLHSTGLAERAWQLARAYARERRQGRGPDGRERSIIDHPDVRRMLLTMKSLTHAARCLAYHAAALLDVCGTAATAAATGPATAAATEAARKRAAQRLALLTPLVKAWCSDVAVEVASLAVQVHGGTGYVDDSEVSQVYRDARIGPIFEGTNYMQAQDLLVRRVIRDAGAALEELLAEVEQAAREAGRRRMRLEALSEPLLAECGLLRAAARELAARSAAEPELAGCVAYPFLQWLAVIAGGWQWALAAQSAESDLAGAFLDCARFYGSHILPRARAHAAAVTSGTDVILTPTPAQI
ncbi:MAG: acyl-CoA dehydrogenase [Steroidobacteraceae bacterium]